MHTSLILAIVAFVSFHQTISADDRVNFTLYYETLCPDCRQFVSTQVWKAYHSILNITNFAVVPYGNARETYDSSSQQYVFTCQHGAQECLGNIIHVGISSINIQLKTKQFQSILVMHAQLLSRCESIYGE